MMSPSPRRSGLTTSATSYVFHRMSKSPSTLLSESVECMRKTVATGFRVTGRKRKNVIQFPTPGFQPPLHSRPRLKVSQVAVTDSSRYGQPHPEPRPA